MGKPHARFDEGEVRNHLPTLLRKVSKISRDYVWHLHLMSIEDNLEVERSQKMY